MKLLVLFLVCVVATLWVRSSFYSFAAQTPSDYADTAPKFSPLEQFNGPILSEGVIYGPTGRVNTTFVAKMNGTWDGNTGTLSEDFTYSSGRFQQRKWNLTAGENGTFTATADDIVGVATGTVSGSTAVIRYKLILPEDAGGYTLDVIDWLYLSENGTIINKSEMRFWGVKVAELVANMRPAGG